MLTVDGLFPASTARLPDSFPTAQSSVSKGSGSKGSGSHEGEKLRKAAGEFEAILLESLWKSMKETFSNQDDENFDPTLQSFDEWGIQGMASAVGKSGGLGIKNMILKHLEPMLPAAQDTNVSAS
jgi:Rod binding domain-containing protein